MRARLVLAIVGLLASSPALPAQAPPAPPMTDCAAAKPPTIKLICNQQAPEDLVVVPGAQWVVASAYSGTGGITLDSGPRSREHPRLSGGIRPQTARREEIRRLPRTAGLRSGCRFTTHGLWLQPGTGADAHAVRGRPRQP